MTELTVAMVMTRQPATVSPCTPFKDILELLAERRADAVPVVSATGLVVGAVSEVDLLRNRTRHRLGRGGLMAKDLMTTPVHLISPSTTLAEASRTLASGSGQVCVVDEGRLVGVLTVRDALSPYCRPDKDILADVERELTEPVRVCVDDGVVQLTGRRPDHDDLDTCLARIRQLPGVIDIKERTR